MFTYETSIFLISAALQLAAVILAIRTARQSAARGPWIAMIAALTGMLVFRVITMFSSGPGAPFQVPQGTLDIMREPLPSTGEGKRGGR